MLLLMILSFNALENSYTTLEFPDTIIYEYRSSCRSGKCFATEKPVAHI